jgi:class 3 adenylate cyclase
MARPLETRASADQSPREIVAAIGTVLRSIGRAPFELEPVLEEVCRLAIELCAAEFGNVYLRDGDVFRLAAAAGGNEVAWAWEREHPDTIDRRTVAGRVALEGTAVHIPDVRADPEYTTGAQDLLEYRTLLGIPLRDHGEVIGSFGLARSTVRPFTDAEIEVVSLFADQATIAIRLAQLFTGTREALERETAVSQVLQTIGRATFDLDAVLQTVVESAVTLSHADFGIIGRLDESTGLYPVVATHGDVSDEYRDLVMRRAQGPGRGTVIGRALVELRPVQILDVLADVEYTYAEAQQLGEYRTVLAVPVLRDDRPVGVTSLARREVRAFSEREIALLTTFADQAALAIANVSLFETVERQRTELARFAPQVASLLSSSEGEQLLAGHRREITALFCDLRGFTAFAEMAEPEEVLGVLRDYHRTVGELAVSNGGTVEHFAGDGLMVFFNDPAPVADHPLVAVRTALAIRDRFDELAAGWRRRGYELGLGVGLALGYATLGRIGFEGRYDYGGVGNVVILASRMSDAAVDGQVLISQRVLAAVEESIAAEPVEPLELKGISRPVPAFSVTGLVEGADR